MFHFVGRRASAAVSARPTSRLIAARMDAQECVILGSRFCQQRDATWSLSEFQNPNDCRTRGTRLATFDQRIRKRNVALCGQSTDNSRSTRAAQWLDVECKSQQLIIHVIHTRVASHNEHLEIVRQKSSSMLKRLASSPMKSTFASRAIVWCCKLSVRPKGIPLA